MYLLDNLVMDLLNLLIKSPYVLQALAQEPKNLNLHELAEIYHQDPAYIGAQIRLTFLAPDIIDAILRGAQPKTMTAKELLRASIPASWPEQRKLFGFPKF